MQTRRALLLVGCLLAVCLLGQAQAQGTANYASFADALNRTPGYTIMKQLANTRAVKSVFNIDNKQLAYTVFAPNDAAFRALAQSLRVSESALSNPLYAGIIRTVVRQHLVPGKYGTTLLNKGLTLTTDLRGYTLYSKAGKVKANKSGVEAKIIRSSYAGKGIVHGVDKVLLPFRINSLG